MIETHVRICAMDAPPAAHLDAATAHPSLMKSANGAASIYRSADVVGFKAAGSPKKIIAIATGLS